MQDHSQNPLSYHPANSIAPSMGGAMSPPQHTSRPSVGEYSYKPRSQTPDRYGFPNLFGTRVHRSSSGSMTQRPGPFEDVQQRPLSRNPLSRFGEPMQPIIGHDARNREEEPSSRARRTSITGILQRPNSQPQPHDLPSRSSPSPFSTVSTRPAWLEHGSANGGPNPMAPSLGIGEQGRRQSLSGDYSSDMQVPLRQSSLTNSYDTRPPGFGGFSQRPMFGEPERERDSRATQSYTIATQSQSNSPEARRQGSDPSNNRGFGRLLNDQMSPVNQMQHGEPQQAISHPITRQDSTQSQNERSVFGDRLDKTRARLFSPFAGSAMSQTGYGSSVAPDDQHRKGSDELSQHRALLGVSAEAKRGGRFSPLPQAVQGAQAQSLGPESGIKTENGRVFSGLGSGIGTSTIGSTIAPPVLTASPFRRDEGPSRLSEENLMKVSRSTPGISKRARKLKDEAIRANSEAGEVITPSSGRGFKKGRHHQ